MWFILGISSGIFHALMSMKSKKVLKDSHQYLAALAYTVFSLPFVLIGLFWQNFAPLNLTFWWAAIVTSLLNVLAISLYMKALKIGELSLTVPFLAFTPVFLIFTSNLMLGELPSSTGILGIFLVVGGTYALGSKKGAGIFAPFKALAKNKGGQLVLLVALIYSISSNLDKIAIENSNPITRIIVVQALMGMIFFFLVRFRTENGLNEVKAKFRHLWPIGLLVALTLFAQMTAFTLTIVPYAVALKRTSAFFSIILGFLVFKERNVRPKLLGATLMIAGILLISMG